MPVVLNSANGRGEGMVLAQADAAVARENDVTMEFLSLYA